MEDKRRKNVVLERLYDMAATVNEETGISELDEKKLRRELEKSQDKNLLRKNKDLYLEASPRIETCTRYSGCPICDKCKNKASHLYIACQKCIIPNCTHDYKTIKKMIVRRNFIVKPKNLTILNGLKGLGDNIETIH